MLFQNSTTGLGAGNGFFLGIGDNEASYVWNYHNEPVIWATNNTERMRLSNTGDVSIGTSGNQTGSKLNVYGAIGGANTRFACTEHGKGASSTYTSIVFDYAVGSPATVMQLDFWLQPRCCRIYVWSLQAVTCCRDQQLFWHERCSVISRHRSTHRVTISGTIVHPVAAVKATAGGLSTSIDLLTLHLAKTFNLHPYFLFTNHVYYYRNVAALHALSDGRVSTTPLMHVLMTTCIPLVLWFSWS